MSVATFGALCILFAGSARADEGMWTFDNFPATAVKQKYGVSIDKSWLDHVRAASVRLSNGCSASLVTAQGLVLTNHHCGARLRPKISQLPRRIMCGDGFSAARREDEAPLRPVCRRKFWKTFPMSRPRSMPAAPERPWGFCEGARRGHRAGRETRLPPGTKRSIAARSSRSIRAANINSTVIANIPMYGWPSRRKRRQLSSAAIPTISTFPATIVDFSFVRLYEKGKSVASPNHLTWKCGGTPDGTPIFVSGNPGSTQRLLTAEQLAFLRDFQLPRTLILYSELRGRLLRFASESAEHERISEDFLFRNREQFQGLSWSRAGAGRPRLDRRQDKI